MTITQIKIADNEGRWTVDLIGSGLSPLPFYDRDAAAKYAEGVKGNHPAAEIIFE